MSEPDFDPDNAIAIVGMAGRFPQAPDIESYWQRLRDGVECFTRYNDDELLAAGVDRASLERPGYVKSGAPLEDMASFDAGFFGFSPRDAAILDPQHRHILECAWSALEDAAIDPERFDGSIGVFAGSGHNAYLPYNLLTNPGLLKSVGFFLLRHTGNDKDFLATRISYCLKLTGPSLNIQTACSTSLVATHLACQSLINRECDLALAGGVTIEQPHRQGYQYEEGEILSPDGHCRAFDAASAGTVFGSGVGVVVLRRYEDAVAAGDIIHAIIRGSAINNDGANKVGYFAPSVEGQAACIGEALALSEVDPETISYVECHGTGTPVGDPIEVAALTQAFREQTTKTGYCGIGSVKPNIGHTDTAAGVASLIKTVLSLKHRQIPANLHFVAPNPSIDFDSSPFYVNHQLSEWKSDGPRRAGVNSLGVGGTNAFVVLEEAPPAPETGAGRAEQLLLLSAKSASALEAATDRLAERLAAKGDSALADAAYTLATGRRHFEQRRALVTPSTTAAANALKQRSPELMSGKAIEGASVAFLFPGGGAQYPNMGRDLYEAEPVYRQAIDEGLGLLSKHVDWDLRPLMFPEPGDEAEAALKLQQGSRSLTSLFITEVALAKLFMAWGATPSALLGHSMGEYVAACLAGVFSVEDGLRLVLMRGQLFETLEPGAMLSVPLPHAELKALIGDGLDIAVVNTPEVSVASGPVTAIDALEATLAAKDVDARRIKIHVAAHSRLLDPILPAFGEFTRRIDFQPPQLPFLSNVSGAWITEAEATDPDYWVRHLRSTVRFSDNLSHLFEDGSRVLLEAAPGRTLSSLARMHPGAGRGRPIFNALRHPEEEVTDTHYLQKVLAGLWLNGVELDWQAFYQGQTRRRIALPTYAFDRQTYWIEPGRVQRSLEAPDLQKRGDIAEWFSVPCWYKRPLPQGELSDAGGEAASAALIFCDNTGLGERLAAELERPGTKVIRVHAGDEFSAGADGNFMLRRGQPGDYERLFETLEQQGLPTRIFHLWSLSTEAASGTSEACLRAQERGFESALWVAQAIAKQGISVPLRLAWVTRGAQQVASEQVPHPEQATLLGPAKVIPHEMANLSCVSVDVASAVPGSWQETAMLRGLSRELGRAPQGELVAYRGAERYERGFESAPLPEPEQGGVVLKAQGVYLISGGLGGLGLVLAEHLVRRYGARLTLIARTALPPRDSWEDHVREQGRDDAVSRRIEGLRALEALGATPLVLVADVCDVAAMKGAVAQTIAHFGGLDGVFHTAGTLDDALIAMKTREQTRSVLGPKVLGALALDAALGDHPLDCFVMYSSVSAITAVTGQVDYAGANAFLDAFAQSRTARRGQPSMAINWGAWQHVGMAAQLARRLGLATIGASRHSARHPLVSRCLRETSSLRHYETDFDPGAFWVLDEHRLKAGPAVMPGTGYLELARAAFTEIPGSGPGVEFSELMFLSPLLARDGVPTRVRTELERSERGWQLEIKGEGGQLHATASIAWHQTSPPAVADLAAIEARCNTRSERYGSAADEHLAFGPRWNCRQSAAFGDKEALVSLQLPEAYAADLPSFALHPALMDFATAGAQALVPGYDPKTHFYVPWSYARVTVYAPLTSAVRSHVRLREASEESATYDVTVYSASGAPLVEIEGFAMKRVASSSALVVPSATPHESRGSKLASGAGNPALEQWLDQGILPEEGMQALERVLAAPFSSQWIVTSQALAALLAASRVAHQGVAEADAETEAAVRVTRPNLATPFVAPEGELQESVVALWEELLGVSGVGVHDDFFDLGGHSLLLTQVVSRLRKQVRTELSLRVLFQKRTVAGIAEEIERAQASGQTGPKAPSLRRVSREAYRLRGPKSSA